MEEVFGAGFAQQQPGGTEGAGKCVEVADVADLKLDAAVADGVDADVFDGGYGGDFFFRFQPRTQGFEFIQNSDRFRFGRGNDGAAFQFVGDPHAGFAGGLIKKFGGARSADAENLPFAVTGIDDADGQGVVAVVMDE